jgi:hypothetical protein
MQTLTCCRSALFFKIRLAALRGLEQGLGWHPPVTAMLNLRQRLRLALLIACLPCLAALPRVPAPGRGTEAAKEAAATVEAARAAAAATAAALPADSRSQVNNATLTALLDSVASAQERAVIYTTFTLGNDAAGRVRAQTMHAYLSPPTAR